jgi:hypothetical protein
MSDQATAQAAITRVLDTANNLEDAVAGVPPEDWETNLAQLLDAQLAVIGIHTELRQTADALWARRTHHNTLTDDLRARRTLSILAEQDTAS